MLLILKYLSVLFLNFSVTVYSVEIFKDNRELLREGEEKFRELDKLSLSPFGSCWTSVISRLKAACPTLTEESHGRLAFGFTTCFMEHLGIPSERCDDDDVTLCLQKVKHDSRWFSAYLQYHTHTHNMCYFLNHQLWLQKTEMTIKKLTATSDEMGRRIEESSVKQQELIGLQSDSVQTQKTLLEQSQVLNAYMENSKNSMIQVFDEFKRTAEGQQTMVMDMLNKLSSWIQFLVDHVTSIYTVAFYFTISILLFIVTATPRTNRARAWLVFVWLFVFLSEFKLKFDYITLWYTRYFGMLSTLVILLYFAMVYKDYETLNNRLLNELYHMVLTQAKTPVLQPQVPHQQALLPSHYDMATVPSLSALRQSLFSPTITELHESSSNSDTSSDETFVGDESETEGSFYSMSSSAASSRSPSPFVREGSQNRDTDLLNSSCGPFTLISTQDMSSGYNLRPRKSLGTSKLNNSILLRESPKSFGRLIKLQERNSRIISVIQTNSKDSL